MSNSTSITDRIGVDSQNLAVRRDFLQLGDRDREVLEPLIPWMESNAADIAKKFYDFQFTFGATSTFFAEHAAKGGIGIQELRTGLEAAQTGYLKGIFEGAKTGWDVAYFARRLHVGAVHDRINLPFKWYLGSYCTYRTLLYEGLHEHFAAEGETLTAEPETRRWGKAKAQPTVGAPTSTAADKVAEVMLSVEKVLNLDLQAIADSFVVSTLEALGMSITDIDPAPGKDRTEYIGEIKASMAESITGVSADISSVSSSATQLGASAREISERTTEVAGFSTEAVDVADNAAGAVKKLQEASDQINRVVSAIAGVADQTNLLALNATIEAARAGEAGKGFAVVANEVKTLAGETSGATVDIERQIGQIRDEVSNAVDAIALIVERVNAVNDLQTTMASAVEEQTTAIDELGKNLGSAADVVEGISDTIRANNDEVGAPA